MNQLDTFYIKDQFHFLPSLPFNHRQKYKFISLYLILFSYLEIENFKYLYDYDRNIYRWCIKWQPRSRRLWGGAEVRSTLQGTIRGLPQDYKQYNGIAGGHHGI